MTLHHIKVFCTVCEEGSMSKAAARLNMTQPGVSKIISDLESYYKTVLFVRKNRKLIITTAGNQYYRDGIDVLRAFQVLETNVRHGQKESEIIFGCTTGLGFSVMSGIEDKFNHKFPGCRLHVVDNSSRNILALVLKGECNLAMVQNAIRDERLNEDVFYQDSLIVVCSPDYPYKKNIVYSIRDLAREDLILMEKGRTTRNMIDRIALESDVSLNPIWSSASVVNLKELAVRGKGVTAMFKMMVQNELANHKLVQIPIDFTLKKDFYLVYRKDKWLSEEEEYLLELCRREGRAEWESREDTT